MAGSDGPRLQLQSYDADQLSICGVTNVDALSDQEVAPRRTPLLFRMPRAARQFVAPAAKGHAGRA